MEKSVSGRVAALALSAAVGVALVLAATPAVAQPFAPGTTADTIVGFDGLAACPPGSPGAVAPETGTINGVFATGGGRCTPNAADAEGSFTVGGLTGQFTAECTTLGEARSGVTVPAGTRINGGAPIAAPQTITGPATVQFPNGQTATLNQISTTATAVTVTAVSFTGGPTLGRVVCGGAYPLAVESAAASEAAPALPSPVSSSGDGGVGNVVLIGAAVLLAVALTQLAVARRFRRGNAGS